MKVGNALAELSAVKISLAILTVAGCLQSEVKPGIL